MKGEQGGIATKDIGKASGSHTRDEYRKECRHRHVDHQHLQRKHQSCDRGLEDTGNGTSGTTADQRHQHLAVQMEQLT